MTAAKQKLAPGKAQAASAQTRSPTNGQQKTPAGVTSGVHDAS
jgi:hypothetical protein